MTQSQMLGDASREQIGRSLPSETAKPEVAIAIKPKLVRPFGWIMPAADGTFQETEEGDGICAKMMPVWGFNGDVLDIVAWPFGATSPWWLRHGAVSWLGLHELWRQGRVPPGEDLVPFVTPSDRPLRLVPTPADWLRDGGCALCVLRWDVPILPLLEAAGGVVCSTVALEKRVKRKVQEEIGQRIRLRGTAA